VSEEGIAAMKQVLGALARRDPDAAVEAFHSEGEFIPILADLEGRVYRGHDGVKQWYAELYEHWEVFEAKAEEFHDFGERVLALGHWHARGRSGVEIPFQHASWVAEMKDGKIRRWRTFTDRDKAVEAASGRWSEWFQPS